jgi:hypothetical protein
LQILKGQSLHTFVEMIGYWLKDARKEHFKVVDVDVFYVEENFSIDEIYEIWCNFYQKLCGVIWYQHIDKAFSWCKY